MLKTYIEADHRLEKLVNLSIVRGASTSWPGSEARLDKRSPLHNNWPYYFLELLVFIFSRHFLQREDLFVNLATYMKSEHNL